MIISYMVEVHGIDLSTNMIAIADDYSKAAFNAAETADPTGAVTGST